MALRKWYEQAATVSGAPGVRGLEVDASQWPAAALDLAAGGGRLLSLWAERRPAGEFRVNAAYLASPGALLLSLSLPAGETTYPGLDDIYPVAARLQRAIGDLLGIRARSPDQRPWLRHAAWAANRYPLAEISAPEPVDPAPPADYPFTRVAGDGVHEIPVGPVHAGIIEPGHFRFSIVGEKVLRLEQRLGYVHKGIERRFTEMSLLEGHRLAARVSGDSAVAYSWAYCQALEGMAQSTVPVRALWLRALALECERIANHLGDLGALGNDAGFAFALAQFSRLKELLLRRLQACFGQRYLMDLVMPGGVAADPPGTALDALGTFIQALEPEVRRLHGILDEHAGVQDRFARTGMVEHELATRLGLTGLAGRASGQAFDLRCDLPCEPYDVLKPSCCSMTTGDVAARAAVRFAELTESCRLVTTILARLPAGAVRGELRVPREGAIGIGLIEGWRGPVLLALTAGPDGGIARCHPHDPSWQNWPVLEHAVIGNIVPDFPLINKSFNLSYSGHDL